MWKVLCNTVRAVALVLVGVALGQLLNHLLEGGAQRPDPAPTVEKIESLAALTTLKVDVADAMMTELAGKTGGVKTVLIVRGDVTLGVDLSGASFEHVDGVKRSAVLRLPQPAVLSARLDQDHTKLVGVWENGLWAITPGGSDADAAAVNHAMQEAQKVVETAGQDAEIVARCRAQTEQVVVAFLGNLKWRVSVEWAPE